MPPRKKQCLAAAYASPSATASSSASSSAAVPLNRRYSLRLHPPQPHQKLHRHALESIFGFLSFDELRSAMFISRRWIEAVYSMRGIKAGKWLVVNSAEQLAPVLQSRLARHVSSFDHPGLVVPHNWSRLEVQQIARRMPFLRRLCFAPLPADDWSAGVRFPPTLHTIMLRIDPYSTPAASINALLSTISQHHPLVDLRITLVTGSAIPRDMSFAPLQSLPALRRLHIHNNRSMELMTFTAAHMNELRALTQLEQLELLCDEATLLQLLEPPLNSQLQWTQLPCFAFITDAVAALLPSLPRLEKLSFMEFPVALSGLHFLTQLLHLTTLDLAPVAWDSKERADALLLALTAMLPQVTNLEITYQKPSTPALLHLMARLPNLREVNLCSLIRLDDLTFLEPVRGSLRKLTLASCHDGLTFDALRVLSSFNLTHLTLDHTLRESLRDPALLALLTPPSTLIPTLQVFEHRS